MTTHPDGAPTPPASGPPTTLGTATLDRSAARLALRATPLLAEFNAAGVLAAADVHVAERLGKLARESDERVLLAVALAVRAVRSGSVCVRLDDLEALAVPEGEDVVPARALPWPEHDAWERAVQGSPLVAAGVGGPADRPARWVDGRLYLDRYWRDELLVRRSVDARLSDPVGGIADDRLTEAVHRLFPESRDDRQRLAAGTSVLSRLTVLTGGPGTGKTTTVARVLAVLQDVAGPGLRIALAAPTGKAAARLQEAVRDEVAKFPDPADQARVGTPEATTLHRLLGWRPGSSTRFRHSAQHHLPHDVVVVDETSMVSLPLMARLLESLRPDARLLLVGDPDQLASVEAGAVLGDLVARPPVPVDLPVGLAEFVPGSAAGQDLEQLRNGVVRLTTVYRQDRDSQILPLAAAIRSGDAAEALAVLRAGGPSVEFIEVTGDWLTEVEVRSVREDAEEAGIDLVSAARAGDAPRALRALEAHRLMLAHRRGPAGVAHWAAQVEDWVSEAAGPDRGAGAEGGASRRLPAHPVGATSPWYPGRPLLVTANDRETGLYNGDTGVIVAKGDGVVAAFGDPGNPTEIRPHRLPAVETVHAMTVHRGQGSQFRKVSLILPPATSPLLTRELLYTAITRAQKFVRVVGTEAAVRAAVEHPVRRASGLREPLA